MSKIYEAAQDEEIERIEGEEQFMNEPVDLFEKVRTNPGINWKNSQDTNWESISEESQRALDMLDYSPRNPNNINPLD